MLADALQADVQLVSILQNSLRPQPPTVPPHSPPRQTLKNAERYITPELKTFEDKALSAN